MSQHLLQSRIPVYKTSWALGVQRHAKSTPRISRRTYASESGGKSFHGQLYDSTHQRLQREKADQARFAQIRGEQSRASGPPSYMVPLG